MVDCGAIAIPNGSYRICKVGGVGKCIVAHHNIEFYIWNQWFILYINNVKILWLYSVLVYFFWKFKINK